ncbi:hypothetical protein [Dehalogenimonas alkenigignens]|uniref:hypothetical protein n=1 Tax=Dehalogenimonas alkenigignens TaxID=1217799 RepID=UPI00163E7038|nr:hypothetical protein [Dehalogenimonas alkenigignens]
MRYQMIRQEPVDTGSFFYRIEAGIQIRFHRRIELDLRFPSFDVYDFLKQPPPLYY